MNISELTPAHIGAWVTYIPTYGKPEIGVIRSWNDKFIFVVYNCNKEWNRFEDYIGCATSPEDLLFGRRQEK